MFWQRQSIGRSRTARRRWRCRRRRSVDGTRRARRGRVRSSPAPSAGAPSASTVLSLTPSVRRCAVSGGCSVHRARPCLCAGRARAYSPVNSSEEGGPACDGPEIRLVFQHARRVRPRFLIFRPVSAAVACRSAPSHEGRDSEVGSSVVDGRATGACRPWERSASSTRGTGSPRVIIPAVAPSARLSLCGRKVPGDWGADCNG